MATEPEAPEPQPTVVERVRRAVTVPEKTRPVIGLAISAGLASLAPFPAGPIAVMFIVAAAADRGRK